MPYLEIDNLKKGYRTPDGVSQPVLDISRFELEEQEQVALAGSSGSGKTTFLNCIAGILRPDHGHVRLAGTDLSRLSEGARDSVRARELGYVFQTFHLLPAYTALENVLLGMLFGPGPEPELARTLLSELGLEDRLHHRPPQMSIGQQQRVAVARALANRPRLVLADEPTGNLDARNSREALSLLRRSCRDHRAALLLVSHDPQVLEDFDRVLNLGELNRVVGSTEAPERDS